MVHEMLVKFIHIVIQFNVASYMLVVTQSLDLSKVTQQVYTN